MACRQGGRVAYDGEFQEQVRQLGQLVAQFDQLPEGSAKTAGKELVQLLMDLHGAGLERMLEIVFESGDAGPGIIEKLGEDSLTGSLLLLYSLHPDDVEARVRKAIERLRPRLRKLSCNIDSLEVREGAVQVRLSTTGHSCGSSTGDLRSIVEDGVFELAPDVASLEILGLAEPAANGFVSLDSLLGHNLATVGSNSHALKGEAAD
jgi:Fe-S cluster biogenesis protein NfuA